MIRNRYLATTLAALLLTAAAGAWNKAGHMVSGAIAYHVLKADHPETVANVVALLGQHPDYDRHWRGRLEASYVESEERDLYLFMLAARWADDARDDARHYPAGENRDRWHYVNLPVRVPARFPATPPDSNNIMRAFATNSARVRELAASPADRAVALTWIFHLVGDVHQPLHVASLFSARFPSGDRGGNRFYIRVREDRAAINLHQFWDDLIIGTDRFQNTRNLAIELRLRPDFQRPKLTELAETSFDLWASRESFALAVNEAYRDGTLVGGTSRSDAPVLPEDYPSRAKSAAERRIILAGYRLAAVLHELMH
ncbi:MAG TPA: S1/P1 nuclease [Gemmatales bacterium]|nr:S1/P1 nuclease [Gemmatales bacterium]HMP59111.1 S1/P1 nuclease [Gemmatales bacterium]